MQSLSQRDLRWSSIKLGSSSLTVGRYGCTTTCISMLSDYFGSYIDPGNLASKTLQYTPEGLLMWPSVNNIPKMRFESRIRVRDDAAIQAALKDPNRAVILNVNNGAHWILAIRKTIYSKDYVCIDPWTGQKCVAARDYHNIVGFATFKRA